MSNVMRYDLKSMSAFIKANISPDVAKRVDWEPLTEADVRLTNDHESGRTDILYDVLTYKKESILLHVFYIGKQKKRITKPFLDLMVEHTRSTIKNHYAARGDGKCPLILSFGIYNDPRPILHAYEEDEDYHELLENSPELEEPT